MYHKIKDIADKYSAKLIVVSKTRSNQEILGIYKQGQRAFAENRVQSLLEKKSNLPEDIEWHIIGHLQTNKVKQIVPFIAYIHSVDSLKLWKEINKDAQTSNRVIPILFQIKIAEEDSKYGFEYQELLSMLSDDEWKSYTNTRICGVMGMATFTDNDQQVRAEFKQLNSYFNDLKERHFKELFSFEEISMGMSGDYEIALEEGSTMLRIGSILFE